MSLETIAVIVPGCPSADHQAILAARQAWGRLCTTSTPAGCRLESIKRNRAGPLRVGYVSAFFHRANWMKPVWGLVNHHDRDRVEVHLFSDVARSRVQVGYRPHASDIFHDITGLSNSDAAALIQQCDLDILVDLNGYSRPARLPMFAFRPAPVIVAWFNQYATTGLESFDYLIGDDRVILEEEEKFYTEKVLRVPGSYLTFEVNYAVPNVVPPPCLSTGLITFGCLASQYKITPRVISVWSRILARCPNARLLLKNGDLNNSGNRSYLHAQFAACVWQGVPLLTYSGDRWVSRTSASILFAGGLGEFVAEDVEGFVELAVAWGRGVETRRRLGELRASMRERVGSSSACDTRTFAAAMEQCYLRISGRA
jgi:predicted O-linked N-acetylglucosamine transferase (SPINDLY family)